ncbi:MAG: S41 family peptidase [Bacteroidota bacterium]
MAIRYYIALCLLTLSLPCPAQKALSLQEAQTDWEFLLSALKENHKGLYLHVPQAVTDQKIDSIRTTLEEGMKVESFFKKVNALLALTNEGHTYARLSGKARRSLGREATFLPLGIQFLGKTAVVHQYYGDPNPRIKRGLKLLSINGKPMEEIIAELLPYIPTDGFSQTGAYDDLSSAFPYYYRLGFGPYTSFTIDFQELEASNIFSLDLEGIKAKQGNEKRRQLTQEVFLSPLVEAKQINDSVAYLAVNSFAIRPKELRAWLQARFHEIAQDSIQHLILDIQDNGGGEEGNENLLMAYLNPSPFQKYAFVSMAKKPFQERAKFKEMRLDKWALEGSEARRGDFTLQSDYFSETGHSLPDSSLVFSGKLYVLTGAETFSGGAEFASMIKMTGRGILVGEETGGAYEGNVSGYSKRVTLPHSRINVSLPIVHFRMNVEPEVSSRGVLPDYVVPQSWGDYLAGRNSKLQFVLDQLIK